MYSLISLIYNKYYLNILTYIVFYTKTFRVTKILSLLIIFFLELFGVQHHTVWLWHSLTIFLGNCSDFRLSWGTELTYIRPSAPTAIRNNVNFTIQNVTREYDNVTMTIQAEIGRRCVVQELHTWYPWWVYVLMYDVIVVWMKVHFWVHSTCCSVPICATGLSILVLSVCIMCACVCAWMRACVCVCVYNWSQLLVSCLLLVTPTTHTPVHTHTHAHAHTHAHIHTCTHTHAHIHTCTRTHMHTYTHAHAHTCTHTHREYVCTCIQHHAYMWCLWLGWECYVLYLFSVLT